MKVTISVGGKFYAFNLASEFEKRGILSRLITSYPKSNASAYGIPKEKTKSILIKEVLERGWRRMPRFLRQAYNPQFFISEVFDRIAEKYLAPHTDLFVGWSSFSLHSLIGAQRLGAITILEHGSSHIVYQDEILREEYKKLGLDPKDFQLAHPKVIEKELKEYEEVNYIAVPSIFSKRTFLEKGVPEEKLIHVPYGVELSTFFRISKKDDVFRLIFGGGLLIRKGVHYLLQAFSELKLANAELLLIGPVSEEIKPFLKKYAGSYQQMEYVPYHKIHEIFSQGSVFVMPSIEEGLAMVQPQAMACGLPVIGTTNSGAEDIVRDGVDGFIVPIRDVAALKEKIMFFYDNPDAVRSMGESARKRVAGEFTWEGHALKKIAIYEKILSGRK